MRSIEQISASARSQVQENQHKLAELAAAKHNRVAELAGKFNNAVRNQTDWEFGETAEDYVTRLGVDVTKI